MKAMTLKWISVSVVLAMAAAIVVLIPRPAPVHINFSWVNTWFVPQSPDLASYSSVRMSNDVVDIGKKTHAGSTLYVLTGGGECYVGIKWPSGGWTLGKLPTPCAKEPDDNWIVKAIQALTDQYPQLLDSNFWQQALFRTGDNIEVELRELIQLHGGTPWF